MVIMYKIFEKPPCSTDTVVVTDLRFTNSHMCNIDIIYNYNNRKH